ncbi:MAG: hypothetical protein V3T31_03330 [candidate division Zixibacteria bacterium]
MSARIGRITARLAEPLTDIPAELIDKINQNICPPTEVTAADVHVRAMYVVSDAVNSYGGRFPIDEHAHLAELLVDSPLLIGHRKDKLPVGRTFHAVTETMNGQHWVKSYFYWLRSADQAESLAENIDGGIYKECSIGFTFALAECSICGKDIRTCDHEPLQSYSVNGQSVECHFNYRKIERVLETSLVYRGATPDTRVSKELQCRYGSTAYDPSNLIRLAEIDRLDSLPEQPAASKYLLIPNYEGMPVTVMSEGQGGVVCDLNGEAIKSEAIKGITARLSRTRLAKRSARLVGFRGKERCSISQLHRRLAGQSSAVTCIMLFLLPDADCSAQESLSDDITDMIRMIPHRRGIRTEIERLTNEIRTKSGVEIYPANDDRSQQEGFLYNPSDTRHDQFGQYTLLMSTGTGHAHLFLQDGNKRSDYILRQFHLPRLKKSGRFVADLCHDQKETINPTDSQLFKGKIKSSSDCEGGRRLTLGGVLSGDFVLRHVTLEGSQRYLFYKCHSTTTGVDNG